MKTLMVKLISVFLICCMLVTIFASCDDDNANTDTTDAKTNVENTEAENSDEVSNDNTEDVTSGATDETTSETVDETTSGTPNETTSETTDEADDEETEHTHNIVVVNAVSPTCTETGLTEGKRCSICNEVIVPQEKVDMKEHLRDVNKKCETCGQVVLKSTEDLIWFADLANDGNSFEGETVYLVNDIELAGISWTPISGFEGVFDGGGHTISNFNIVEYNEYNGFFTAVCEIRNLGITDFSIKNGGYVVGGLAGSAGVVTNCFAVGFIEFSKSSDNSFYVGGLAGLANDIVNCYTDVNIKVTVTGEFSEIFSGGLVGEAKNIKNCNSSGSVYAKAPTTRVGGLAGSGCTVTDSYATGDVEAVAGISGNVSHCAYAGGLVGYNDAKTISNCYATGDVNAKSGYTAYAGGLTGYNNHEINDCWSSGTVTASFSGNSINKNPQNLYAHSGGIVGFNANGTIKNCYSQCSVNAVLLTNPKTAYAYAGGLIGSNYHGNVEGCFAEGAVSATSDERNSESNSVFAGGLIGQNYYKSSVKYCYATGDVSFKGSFACVGGLIGRNGSNISGEQGTTTLDCYSTGNVISDTESGTVYAGGLIGHNYVEGSWSVITVKNCFAVGDVRLPSSVGDVGKLIGYTSYRITIVEILNCYGYDNQTLIGKHTNSTNCEQIGIDILTSVEFQKSVLGWSGDVWNFEGGCYPSLK